MSDKKDSIPVKEELAEDIGEKTSEKSWSVEDFEGPVKHEEALSFANYFIKGWDKETGSVLVNLIAGIFCILFSVIVFIFVQAGIIRTILLAAIVSEELDEIPAWVDLALNLMNIMSLLIFLVGSYYVVIGYLHYRKFSIAKEYMFETNVNLRSKIKNK
tara:strand:- start:80 stop:556 length:477 start_codon:yes stop_codon:yes gene_type:complete